MVKPSFGRNLRRPAAPVRVARRAVIVPWWKKQYARSKGAYAQLRDLTVQLAIARNMGRPLPIHRARLQRISQKLNFGVQNSAIRRNLYHPVVKIQSALRRYRRKTYIPHNFKHFGMTRKWGMKR